MIGQGETMDAEATEKYRRECEARAWLALGYTSKEKVDELVERIGKRRGLEAANLLREDMRAEMRRAIEEGKAR